MSRKYKITDQDKLYFVTFTVVKWVDIFTRQCYRELVLESLRFCQRKKGLEVYAWVIMSNHLHLILGTHDRPLEGIIRDFKSFTSTHIKKMLQEIKFESRKKWLVPIFEEAGKQNTNNNEWQLWQQHNHPLELRSNLMTERVLDYIHFNPVKAGLVAEPHFWQYSSAIDYCGGKGLLDICFIE